MIRRVILALLLLASPVSAGWWEIEQAAGRYDLATARSVALETVASSPESAEAVAAAVWWLLQVDNLAEPEAILSAAGHRRDPELVFVLDRIEAELRRRPPRAALSTAELSGPFGSYSTLDLERRVVPDDEQLPPLGTPWNGPGEPFRLTLRTGTGRVTPPELMLRDGIYLAAWTFALEQPSEGWLVVEARGGLNLEVDGKAVTRLRHCGVRSPAVTWFAFAAQPGLHRIRAEIASPSYFDLRISLLDRDGSPLPISQGEGLTGRWAASQVAHQEPPAAEQLLATLDGTEEPVVPDLLLAAAIAVGRGDPTAQRRWIVEALAAAPSNPWAHLAHARFLLSQPTGGDNSVDLREARDHLRKAAEIPLSLLLERALAMRQNRNEDQENILVELVQQHPDDPRVLHRWVREAVRRGWVREAEEGMQRLLALLPTSRGVLDLRLAVLEALEHWQERNALLMSLSHVDTLSPQRVEELASSCFSDQALDGLRELQTWVDDFAIDLGVIRLLLESNRADEAAGEIEKQRQRWGTLEALDHLALVVAAHQGGDLDQALNEALARAPANLDLLTLAWRRGRQPFFAPFAVDGLEVAEHSAHEMENVDAVMLLDQAVERIFADGSSLYYYHGLTRTYTPEGARQAAVLQQMPNAHLLKVRIIKPDGRIVVPPEVTAGNGTLTLSGIKEGDLVEEEYVAAVSSSHPTTRGHITPYVYRFADATRAFGLSEYALLIPKNINLIVEGRFEGLVREDWDSDELRGVRWRAERVPPVPPEPLSPPTQELLPWVTYGFGVSWQDVGDTMRDRVLSRLVSSPELDAWAEPLLAGEHSLEAVRQLCDALLDEVEAGQATLALGYSAGESFARREGNRLAILATVLVDAGWSVDMVLARPLPFARTHLEVPSMEAFSMPLLRVTAGDESLWVDLSEDRGGIGHIKPMVQGSDGLLLPLSSPDTPSGLLGELPSFANPDLEERISVRARATPTGTAILHFEMELNGSEGEAIEQRLASVPEERESMIFAQLAANLFAGAEDVRGEVQRVEDDVSVHLRLRLPGACTLNDDEMNCRDLVPYRPLVPALASLPQRHFPLILQLPVVQTIALVVEPPPGWTLERPPRRLDSRWGSVNEVMEHGEHGAVHSLLSLTMPAQTVPPDEYQDFARFCHAADELISRPTILVRVED